MSHAVKRATGTRAAAWRHLAERIGPDIALVQEGAEPSGVVDEVDDGSGGGWGTRVVSYGPPIRRINLPLRPVWNKNVEFQIPDAARARTLAIAEVDLGDGTPLVAISLYWMLRYADQSVVRAISDVIPLFDTPLRQRVILGGDLNIHTHSDNPAERRRARPILDLIESLGLRNLVRDAKERGRLFQGVQIVSQPCPCDGTDCYHVRTHRHSRHQPGAMANNDYLFGSQ
jgi:hypothetical protein